jgi:CheY-like chemotaxis protein
MDIMMPIMDGYEAIEKIRQQSRWQCLPIIAITAATKQDEDKKCLRLSATDFLHKPVDVNLLVEKMAARILPMP